MFMTWMSETWCSFKLITYLFVYIAYEIIILRYFVSFGITCLWIIRGKNSKTHITGIPSILVIQHSIIVISLYSAYFEFMDALILIFVLHTQWRRVGFLWSIVQVKQKFNKHYIIYYIIKYMQCVSF